MVVEVYRGEGQRLWSRIINYKYGEPQGGWYDHQRVEQLAKDTYLEFYIMTTDRDVKVADQIGWTNPFCIQLIHDWELESVTKFLEDLQVVPVNPLEDGKMLQLPSITISREFQVKLL